MPQKIEVKPKELILYLQALQPRVTDAIKKLEGVSGPLLLEVPRHLVPIIAPKPGGKCGPPPTTKADDQTLAEILVFVLDAFANGGKKKG